jgi:transcriptional regulator with XRE-family HTH domain
MRNAAEYVALGQALRVLRRRAGLTQAQAAERIGIRSQFVSEVERGHRGMRWHMIVIAVRA